VKVRQLVPGDDPGSAILLLQRFFREEGFDTPDDVIAANTHRMLGLDVCAILQAEEDGVAIGVATVSMDFGIEFGWSAEMGDLYILPEWRGRGVARLIVAAAEDYLRARGAAGYQVTVTPFGEQSHGLRNFYRALGFAEEGRELLYRRLSGKGA
jgi:GNAT superfamily N-acetyltransferase